jgi:gas vesicle protein
MRTLEQQIWEGEAGRRNRKNERIFTAVIGGILASIAGLTFAPLLSRDYNRQENPKARIFQEDRDGDGIPEYIKQELIDGEYQTTKILKGYLDTNGNVDYSTENSGQDSFY